MILAYESNFETVKKGNDWVINVKENLQDEVLNSEKQIIVTLQARLEESGNVGNAIIIVDLPSNQDLKPAPKFSQTYYTAQYIDNETQISGEPIKIESTFEDQVIVTLEDSKLD